MHSPLRSLVLAVIATSLVSGCSPADGPGQDPESGEAPAPGSMPVLVRPDGTYPVKALEKDNVVVKVIQNGVTNLQQAPSIEAGLKANLEKMASLVQQACSSGAKPDFLLFNEFPLTGYSAGSRDEKLKFTIRIPGPETERLGALARECDTYIIFGSYARDDEWPGHILSINTVLDRQGRIAQKYWKTRNITRLTPGEEIPTTTIENVRDKFRARYGIEAEFPVLQTEYGNIAVSTVQLDPFVFAAFAMRGVEIMFRTATLFSPDDVKATARYHNVYSAMSNITFPPDSPVAAMGGQSLIVSPRGEVLAEDPTNNEGIIEATIPIADFRRNRRIPRYPLEVVAPVFEQYRQELPLNHLDLPPGELPRTGEEMKAVLDRLSRWLNAGPP
jgi:predicted amidohydrolase